MYGNKRRGQTKIWHSRVEASVLWVLIHPPASPRWKTSSKLRHRLPPYQEETAVATLKRYSWSRCLCHPHCSIKELLCPNVLKHENDTKWHMIWQVKKTRSWSTGELQPQHSRNNVCYYPLTDTSWKQGSSLSLQGVRGEKSGRPRTGPPPRPTTACTREVLSRFVTASFNWSNKLRTLLWKNVFFS